MVGPNSETQFIESNLLDCEWLQGDYYSLGNYLTFLVPPQERAFLDEPVLNLPVRLHIADSESDEECLLLGYKLII